MTLEEYEKEKVGQTIRNKGYLKNLLSRTLLTVILILSVLIVSNFSASAKEGIVKYLFQTDFKFSTINKIYNKYFLDIFKKKENIKPVNLDKNIDFDKAESYKDGVSIPMSKNSTISLLNSGIVVYIGEKGGYNNTIIIQQSNGIDVWYGNVDNVSAKLYDYIEKNTVIATSKEKLYLVFQKDGKFLDYKTIVK